MSVQKTLSTNDFSTNWYSNKEALLSYLEHALYGINGIVTDSHTGEPLAALINVNGHDTDETEMLCNSENGDYYRMIKDSFNGH